MPLPILLLAALAGQPGGMVATNTAPQTVAVPAGRPLRSLVPEANEAPADSLDIRISSGSELLWEGRVRVGKPGASLTQHLFQSEPPGCPPGRFDGSVHQSVSLTVQRLRYSTNAAGVFTYPVRVGWERPALPGGCGGAGTRSVEIREDVELRPGERAVLRGDVGLQVEIRRR